MNHFEKQKNRARGRAGSRPVWWGLVLILSLAAVTGLLSTQTSKAQGSATYFLPIISVNYQLTGEITGVVLNAADAVTPIPNAQVCLDDGSNCVVSDGMGTYTLTEVPIGTTELTASAFGFFDQTETIEVKLQPGQRGRYLSHPFNYHRRCTN